MFKDLEITEELSRSTSSILYLGHYLPTGQQVVVKAFHYDEISDISKPEQLLRFRRECEIHLFLKHPRIVPAIKSFEVQGLPHLVLEYKPYHSLRKVIERHRHLSILHTIYLIQQLCQAVFYIHEQGIIHRDIKPENILISPNLEVFLTDFGCSRKVFAPNITQNKMILGTLNYMSPEQLMGREDIDFRSDIFSIGVILYQLLTQELPFHGHIPVDIVQNLLYSEPGSLTKINPLLPEKLEKIVQQTLQKDPDYRTPTAKQLAVELESILAEPWIYHHQATWILENNGTLEEATHFCQIALQKDPHYVPALLMLGELEFKQAQLESAAQYYQRAMLLQPHSAEIHFQLGQIQEQQNEPEQALHMYQRALILNPHNRQYAAQVAKILQVLGCHQEATAHYQELIHRYPEWAVPMYQLGRCHYQVGLKEKALYCFQKAHRLQPDNDEILYNLGALYHELGHYNEAIATYQMLFKIRPEFEEIKHNLALLYYLMGDIEKSRQLLEDIVNSYHWEHNYLQNTQWEMSYTLLGFVYTKLNQHEKATESFKYAIRSNPENPVAYLYLASSYRDQLRLNDAIDTLTYAASQPFGNHHASVYYILAKAYYEQGREKEAISALERCLRCPDVSMGMIGQVKEDLNYLKSKKTKKMSTLKTAAHAKWQPELIKGVRYVV